MAKIGLVVEGGGMKCAYAAAIQDRFLDDGISFPYVIGVSAGCSNSVTYLAGQRGRNLRFYIDHVKDPRYFGLRPLLTTGNLFGLQFIYGTLSNSDGKDPLDFEALMRNPAEFVYVATDVETGLPHYFHKEDLKKDDYRAIMASCSLPAINRPVTVHGKKYVDGGISDAIPVRKALADGCDYLVVILSKPRDFVKTPEKHRALYSLACAKYPAIVRRLDRRHIMYGHVQKQAYNLERHGRAFLFAPSEKLPMSTYEMDPEKNQALYDLGLRDYEDRKAELAAFIKHARDVKSARDL